MKIKTTLVVVLSFLFFCSCYSQVPNEISECRDQLLRIKWDLLAFNNYPDPTALSNVTVDFVALSGRFLNDFGEYEVCQNNTASRYLSLKFPGTFKDASFEGIIGFCGPTECSDKEALENKELIVELYKQGMGFPLDTVTKIEKIDFYDPKSPAPGDKTTTGIIFGVLGLFVVITLAGTGFGIKREILDHQKKKKLEGLREGLLGSEVEPRVGGEQTQDATQPQNPPAEQRKRELRGIWKFLDCFDMRKNFDKITKVKYTETYDHNLEIFNGIRVLMMLYVVYGHSFMFGTSYIDNLLDLPDLVRQWTLLIIYAALYSVDVFFYMGGFLFAYIGTGKLRKVKPSLINYIGLCFHRLLRFWPTYVVAIIIFWRVLPLTGEGPVWFKLTYYTQLCEGSWWQNFALLDDMFVKKADYCFGWGWYLSNDFQMFLITPFFIWLYIKNRTAGKLAMFALICFSWMLALVIGADLHVRGTPPSTGGVTNEKGFALYYVKPYIRLPPYFFGILVALMYKEYKEQIGSSFKIGTSLKNSTVAKTLMTVIGFAITIGLIFIVRPLQFSDSNWDDWAHITYKAFSKSLYVIGLTLIITPILLGDHSLLKRFLAHPIFVPLARLSFTAYLVHLMFIYKNYYELPFSFHMSYPNATLNTISNAALAFAGGLALSLLVEVPMANIEAGYLSGGGGKRKPAPKKAPEPAKEEEREASIIPIDNEGKTAN